MNNQCEIVFFLDNSDLSIIEVEQADNSGLSDMFWFIYNKASHTISQFKFKTSLSGQKWRKHSIKRGLLRFNGSEKYSIEIDRKVFDFKKHNPEEAPENAIINIKKYLDAVV